MKDLLLGLFAPGDGRFNRVELMLRDLPPWLLGLMAAAVGLGLVIYLAGLWREPRAPRLLLGLLRGLAAGCLLAIVLGPAIELQRAIPVTSRVAILVDGSASMGLKDGDRTRIERAREIGDRAAAGLGRRFEVETWVFDGRLRRLGGEGTIGVVADGAATDLSGALAGLSGQAAATPLAGILLLSDGADNVRLRTPAEVERRRGEWPAAPVYPILLGDAAGFRDQALGGLRYDRFGFARHPLGFDLTLSARGLAGQRYEVTLYEDGAPRSTLTGAIPSNREELPLSFEVKPERPGFRLFAIEARGLPGEAVAENNRVEFAVSVGPDQVRVLLICGRPSWDERFLRQTLKHDPNVDLVSFFILRDTDDAPGVPQDALSLIPFPVNDLFTTELDKFDVVILQDFNRRAFLSQLHLESLHDFVVERGGGLALVGGDLGMRAGGYAGTPVEDILPFRLGSGPDSDPAAFQPLLTEAGASHFITALEPDPAATRALLKGLPAFDGANLVGPVQPGGVTLLAHPTLLADGQPMPVLGARSVGRGRTLALGVDSSWYWAFRNVGRGGTSREYLRLWQNALRWLSHDPSAKFLSLSGDRDRSAPGEPVGLSARALKGDYGPWSGGRIRISTRRAADGRPAGDSEGVSDPRGLFRAEVAPAEEGFYRSTAELRDARGETIDRDEWLLEVRRDRTELEQPAPRPELLAEVARATGGALLEAGQAASPPIRAREAFRLGERKRVELWDNGALYGVLLLTLATEWWLRRRAGLR